MIYNELFESVIRETIYESKEKYLPKFHEPQNNALFEQVLREASCNYYGLFSMKNYKIKAINIDSNINTVLHYYVKNANLWKPHEVLPCGEDGSAMFKTEE
jgi:hypothetical protein